MTVTSTKRLIISQVTETDAPFFVELMNTPSWIKYIGDRNIKSVKDAENYLKNGILKSYKESGYGFYKVAQKIENNILRFVAKDIEIDEKIDRQFYKEEDMLVEIERDTYQKMCDLMEDNTIPFMGIA